MKIEVGEFVRTKNGKIRKVKSTVAQYYITDRLNISDNNQFTEKEIVKHSKNIIDLLEIDDFIKLGNDCYPLRVDFIWENGEELNIELEGMRQFENIKNDKDFKIYSVLTHEQFSSLEYII